MQSVEMKSGEPFDDQPVVAQQASVPTTLHIPEAENATESSPARPPRAVLTFEKLTVQTDGSARRFNVLDNVSGMIGPGLTAIMGPTGSGKSVLLNTLLGHVPPGLEKTSGTVCLNGKTFTAAQAFFSLVHQIDELSGSLTVGETLSYAAELQLSHLTPKRRAARVTQLLQDLGLSHVRNVLVGGALRKGISGGQRKRVSIALGLLASPSLLVLDEPTAGLDSVTAMRVLTLLKALAERDGTTVLCVIHQPQRAIYELLDRLILLRSGEIIYDGDAGSCVSHLASIGYEYDGVTNPADHIMEVISPALGETQDALRERCLTRRDYFAHEHSIDHNINNKMPLPRAPSRVTAASQFRVLLARQFLNEVRSYQMHLVNLVITLLSSFLIGATWYRMDKNGAGSQALRTPAVFFCVINQSLFGAMKSVLAFPEHRSLMLRERRAKLYTAFPAFAAWMTVDFLSTLPWTIIYCVVSYFMMGLRTDSAGHFFIFLVLLFFAKVVASAMAIFVCSLAAISGSATAATMATVILPVVLELSRLFGGFFLPPSLLPGYFKWLDPLSYVKYGYVGAALNELDGLTLACPPGAASCNPRASDAQIKSLRLDFISVGGCIGGLIGFYLGFCIVSYILLRLSKH